MSLSLMNNILKKKKGKMWEPIYKEKDPSPIPTKEKDQATSSEALISFTDE